LFWLFGGYYTKTAQNLDSGVNIRLEKWTRISIVRGQRLSLQRGICYFDNCSYFSPELQLLTWFYGMILE